ncbi:MAG TPA: plastocyanin/azurin family copper-binding protein [Acidimicrobiales bacterium]
MRRLAALLVAAGLVAAVAPACGDDGPEADRTVEVRMVDIAFEPAAVTASAGETVRFRFANDGQQGHDAVVGPVGDQDALEAHIRSGAGYDYYDEDDAVLVEPGGTGELVVTFDEAGTTLIACHRPGHYDSGMILTVEVT